MQKVSIDVYHPLDFKCVGSGAICGLQGNPSPKGGFALEVADTC